jgi:hypothetical protein
MSALCISYNEYTDLDIQAGKPLLHDGVVVCRVFGGVAMTMVERGSGAQAGVQGSSKLFLNACA